MNQLLDRVIVHEDRAEVFMRSDGLHSLVDVLDSREERKATLRRCSGRADG